MQRPRRTSEFHDDPGGVRRQSRPQTRSTVGPSPSGGVGGTAVKFAPRQSRIAVLSRSSSRDKSSGGSCNAYLSVPTSTQRGFTPQKTPLSNKINANRVLFTAEKHRSVSKCTAGSGPLHNDKKWIHEQSQRISEYLKNFPTISGLSSDFLSRGLRQMSIKQFVAIVNFFLSSIWGKRYVVGSNHVEDIIQILQKLQYPYAVNKSWLKTPNTQHSFGNVIVLLDFFMDFVAPFTGEEETPSADDNFELQEPNEVNISRAAEDIFQIPDLEFQYEMLRNSEEGFMLWDTQMENEFLNLQKSTYELLIQKTCNFPNAEAIESEIEKLRITLKASKENAPVQDTKLVKAKSDKAKKFRALHAEFTHRNEIFWEFVEDRERLNKKTSALSEEVDELEKQIKKLQETLGKQLCSVEQRDQLIAEKTQIEQMLKIEINAVRNIEDRNYQKQVIYTRVLRRFTDQVELFNEFMREIAFSDIPECRKTAWEDLQLQLRPNNAQLQKLMPLLHKTKKVVEQSIKENKEKICELNTRTKEVANEADTQLETQLNSLRSSNTTATCHLEKLRQYASEVHPNLNAKIQAMHEELATKGEYIEHLQQLIAQKQTEIELAKEQNESTMRKAEEKHERYLAQRRAFLEAYNEALETSLGGDVLPNLRKQIEQLSKQFEEFRKQL